MANPKRQTTMEAKNLTRAQVCNIMDDAHDTISELERNCYDLLRVATDTQKQEFERLIYQLRRQIERIGLGYLERNNK